MVIRLWNVLIDVAVGVDKDSSVPGGKKRSTCK